MQVQRKKIDELLEDLDQSYSVLYDELNNERIFETKYVFANLMEIDKVKLDKYIASLNSVLKSIKAVKPFDPKKAE